MVTFSVDNSPIIFYNVWYNYQSVPRPGGHTYSVRISFSEKEIIEVYEKFTGVKVSDSSFEVKALAFSRNSFNLITWALDQLTKKNEKLEFDIKWVFNSIESVRVSEEEIIIKGIASPALENY